tara:strand:- start:103 stop:684 length:582 start_codon:yes stop_codon:yes gene_type:complete
MRTHDGVNVNYDPTGNCMNLSAEVAELFYPVTYEAFEIRRDSAGAGASRGGLGAQLQIRFKGHAELSIETSRTIEGSPGIEGGHRSPVQTLFKVSPNGDREVIGGWKSYNEWVNPLLAAYRFDGGEAFRIETTGGGGLGNPLVREPEKVLEDVLDDYVSIEAARERYGVVIDPSRLEIDRAATEDLRSKRVGE